MGFLLRGFFLHTLNNMYYIFYKEELNSFIEYKKEKLDREKKNVEKKILKLKIYNLIHSLETSVIEYLIEELDVTSPKGAINKIKKNLCDLLYKQLKDMFFLFDHKLELLEHIFDSSSYSNVKEKKIAHFLSLKNPSNYLHAYKENINIQVWIKEFDEAFIRETLKKQEEEDEKKELFHKRRLRRDIKDPLFDIEQYFPKDENNRVDYDQENQKFMKYFIRKSPKGDIGKYMLEDREERDMNDLEMKKRKNLLQRTRNTSNKIAPYPLALIKIKAQKKLS